MILRLLLSEASSAEPPGAGKVRLVREMPRGHQQAATVVHREEGWRQVTGCLGLLVSVLLLGQSRTSQVSRPRYGFVPFWNGNSCGAVSLP